MRIQITNLTPSQRREIPVRESSPQDMITKKSILKKLEGEKFNLYYVDYNDELSPSQLQEAFHNTDDFCPEDYYETYDIINYYIDDIYTQEEKNFIYEDDQLREEIEEYIYNNDESNLTKDLLSNTREYQCFYDTGIQITDDIQDFKNGLKQLGIKIRINEDNIKELQGWNSYGGTLQILFQPDNYDLYKECRNNNGKKKIVFDDPCIGISNYYNGSGGFQNFIGTIELPFEQENIYVYNEGPGYSLCQVYGDNKLGDSHWEIKEVKRKQKTYINLDVKRYAKWDADLKKGICHFDDPRFNSHKTEYINDVPCGWKCKRCGRFYID